MSNLGLIPDPDEHQDRARALHDGATESHALAVADHDEKGLVQQVSDDGVEVRDLGWNEPDSAIPGPLVGGLQNEQLWLLIRRFDKQMYHVKETKKPVLSGLDLQQVDDLEFSPDRLRATLERLYMTIVIGSMSGGKQIARLRSWREWRRTTGFFAAYCIAWLLDLLVPLFALTMVVLIVYTPSRAFLFPPAPLALVDGKTGGVQKPKAGVLGSRDSATGAPENHKGEAVEAEASNFVNGIASIAIASASGKHPQSEPSDQGDPQDAVPDPTAVAVSAGAARASAAGGAPGTADDKAKVPMETAMWSKMRPIMRMLSDACDGYEMLANCLSPTKPFSDLPRWRLAGVVVPLLAVSMFVTSYMFIKSVTFFAGFALFGQPIITRLLVILNSTFPHWQKLLELRNTVLKGCPCDRQLTITLLRLGEANKAPLPPAPTALTPPPDEPVEVTDEHLRAIGSDYPMNATEAELNAAIAVHDPSKKHETAGSDIDVSMDKKHGKKGSKVLAMFKSGVKGTIEPALGADRIKASAGSQKAKNRLGVVPKDPLKLLSGPTDFACRFKGKRGTAYISQKSVSPCIAFSLLSDIRDQGSDAFEEAELRPVWSVAIAEIVSLEKVGGLGWKSKLVVGWALGKEVADGLEITTRTGEQYTVTAMVERDPCFNRLIAMGGQKWEAW